MSDNLTYNTLIDLLRERYDKDPDKIVLTYLKDGEALEQSLTFNELDQIARKIAVNLHRYCKSGDRAILIYDSPLDFICAFFGCSYAGVIAIPFMLSSNKLVDYLMNISKNSKSKVVLTTDMLLSKIKPITTQVGDFGIVHWISTDDLTQLDENKWEYPNINKDSIALLQYTSGSTGIPKGVMISHMNLLSNLDIICKYSEIDSRDLGVFWLPHYHNLGLINGLLLAIYANFRIIHLPTALFLQKPVRWLNTISRYKATISGAPNFAYDLCCLKVTDEMCKDLDLSSWTFAFSGGDIVHKSTLDNFTQKFGKYGFKYEAFFPCYGLAEGTLYVSGPQRYEGPVDISIDNEPLEENKVLIQHNKNCKAREFVSVGRIPDEIEYLIINYETKTQCAENEIGELWIKGHSIAKGYWGKKSETEETFNAFIDNHNKGPYLRTGDEGFVLDGNLFLVGRIKNMIKINGKNYHAEDIVELIEGCHADIKPSSIAAFWVNISHDEKLVIVSELKETYSNENFDNIISNIKDRIFGEYQMQVYSIVLVNSDSIDRTYSGKIQNFMCKKKFIEKKLSYIYEWNSQCDDNEKLIGNSRGKKKGQENKIKVSEKEIEEFIVSQVIQCTGMEKDKIDVNSTFINFGLDSVKMVNISGELETFLNISLPPTIVYEYPTIHILSNYLINKITGNETDTAIDYYHVPHNNEYEPIAIVGIAGIMPKSDDLEEFWSNLVNGVDMVSEIPKDRWDYNEYYGDPQKEANKTNIIWGGFMNEVDKFDPLFFGISPREAILMDPQQRIFMQTVWKTIEDAGYKPSDLSGTKTGLFVGVATSDYNEIITRYLVDIEAYTSTGLSHSILANRISYLLNLRGPSEPIDTACSSSLVAIHRAINAIHQGDCEMALAGGINIILTPTLHISFSKAGMLSQDGRCKTFDKSANGYVRGEGCGAIFLKPLKKAILDGDHVYAVIRGSSENHGGHTNSLTAPNSNAQAEVIVNAWRKSQIDTSTISYIEAHGTGTSLGDPIEINGIRKAFEGLAKLSNKPIQQMQCKIGTVKSNIGHLEAAAGIAGILKIILSMRYGIIPGNLNFKELNPYIDLKDSPLAIVNSTMPWEHLIDNEGNSIPRRAGISSFGFGGVNSHIVLEEYIYDLPKHVDNIGEVIILSAKNKERLIEYARQMAAHLEKYVHNEDVYLESIAYTLQIGREAMEERIAIVTDTVDKLIETLKKFIAGDTNQENLYVGNVKSSKRKSELLVEGKEGEEFLRILIHERKINKLAMLWVNGIEFDWRLIYKNQLPKRISLPTYQFAKKRYWITDIDISLNNNFNKLLLNKLSEVIDSNESTLMEQCYKKRLIATEFYLKDHIINNKRVLPGVVYLEMARSAGELACGDGKVAKIKNIIWQIPIVVEQDKEVLISLHPNGEYVDIEISTINDINDEERIIHATASIELQDKVVENNDESDEYVDISSIIDRCKKNKNVPDYYDTFKEMGLSYGHSFRVINEMYYNESEAISMLLLPETLRGTRDKFLLHPTIIDGALQTAIGLVSNNRVTNTYLPFALDEIEILNEIEDTCYAYVTRCSLPNNNSKIAKFDITILNDKGKVLIRIKKFTVKELEIRNQETEKTTEKIIDIDNSKNEYNNINEWDTNGRNSGAIEEDNLQEELDAKVEQYLKEILSKETKVPIDQINSHDSLGNCGIDSIMIMSLTRQIESKFGEISKTLFFEYNTIEELASYFIENHRSTLDSIFSRNDGYSATTIEEYKKIDHKKIRQRSRFISEYIKDGAHSVNHDIAIIGLSGKYPMAKDLGEFWDNLKNSKDCICEIPKDRWDYNEFFDEEKGKVGKTYSKWGGFINDVDKFDAAFFNISPKEAEILDPQERLFLETVWHAIEDAGYKKDAFNASKTGVFVGVMYGQYQLIGQEESKKGNVLIPGSFYASIANRVSYYFNLNGPSIALDTMCSSSLTAIHLACESIKRGESNIAIAGGVNITIHPNKYIFLSQGRFTSSDGRCKSFGEGGDGYVPGEGVGAVILKPLEQAIGDNDHVYAVIKGSSINHGGRTSGYTVPNPNAQRDLIIETLEKSNINPRSISYVEAHGTGTSLGDPIEITGLVKAFKKYTYDKQFCKIGSVKSNIGHLESAAGISGITKILLQMENKQLVPSILSDKLNPNIDFNETPFIVQHSVETWEKPKVIVDGCEEIFPRRAAISSFGAGGSNAHIILEEYETQEVSGEDIPQVITLSARNQERLKEYMANLVQFLKTNYTIKKELTLSNIAYTLKVGREEMKEKIFIVCKNVEDLIDKLTVLIEKGQCEGCHENNVDIHQHSDKNGRRISLPGYPFARDRHWITVCNEGILNNSNSVGMPKLHPLINFNTSNFMEEKFTTVLTGNEFYLRHHKVANRKVLPGVIYIEMALACGQMASLKKPTCIKDIVWINAIRILDKPLDVHISLYPEQRGNCAKFNIWTTSENGHRVIHSKGRISFDSNVAKYANKIDIEEIKNRCNSNISRDECYKLFNLIGITYGDSFKPIKEVYSNSNESLAILEIPNGQREDLTHYTIHPSILDGAFQAIIGFINKSDDGAKNTYLPFALGKIDIFDCIRTKMFAHVTVSNENNKHSNEKKFNINIANEEGNVCIKITNFTVKSLQQISSMASSATQQKKHISKGTDVIYCEQVWEKSQLDNTTHAVSSGNILIFDNNEELYNKITKYNITENNQLKVTLVLPGDKYEIIEDNKYKIDVNEDNGESYGRLVEELTNRGTLPDNIIYMWSIKPFDSLRMKHHSHNSVQDILQECHPERSEGSHAIINEKLNLGVYSIFYLTKELTKHVKGKKIQLLFVNKDTLDPIYNAISGFMKSIRLENPRLLYKTLNLVGDIDNKINILLSECNETKDIEVLYENGERYIRKLRELQQCKESNNMVFRENGVYLITGGMGGLGLLFAKYILNKSSNAKIILTGRSSLNEDKKVELQKLGKNIIYIKSDIANKDDVIKLIKKCKVYYDEINGVIHSAGVIRDAFLIKKTKQMMADVLLPKIYGTINLDNALKDEELDFFVLFSSISGAVGNVGQCDYSYANSFMDNFASIHKEDKRYGKILSINWPLWQDGGMKIDEQTKLLIHKTTGIKPLGTDVGFQAFSFGLNCDKSGFIVMQGDLDKIRQTFKVTQDMIEDIHIISEGQHRNIDNNNKCEGDLLDSNIESTDKCGEDLLDSVKDTLINYISNILHTKKEDIEPDADLSAFGFDSISLTQFGNEINNKYNLQISATLFFEYTSISALAQYIAKEYNPITATQINDLGDNYPREINKEINSRITRMYDYDNCREFGNKEPIAIIGMAGIMPKSDDLEAFWSNLINGIDMISEIPKDRWDYNEYYGDPEKEVNKTNVIWGGFMNEVDKFDPLFFGISPKEAELMDPQQRLFIQTVWKTIEDAGYKASDLSGTKTGLFVGVATNDYSELLNKNSVDIEAHVSTGLSHSILANRISYLFNFRGPSEPIDTACSSALVAIHRAIDTIRNGDCDMAIAGGVNVILTPTLYISFNKAGMLSKDGRCKTFDKSANGYVRGEGCGAVLLKPLSRAIEDKDHIYAIITASSENHGGRANSLTAPNPNAQAELIVNTWTKAGVDPSTITYIETHGTGTSLGDPIEINGLKKAFKELNDAWQITSKEEHCGIGAVKTNIGHLETAAGIAGIIKVLLSMKHGIIPGNLNFKELNPLINFNDSPLYIIDKNSQWKRKIDSEGFEIPRRAGISSFGFGGVNCHVALEECQVDDNEGNPTNSPVIITLSAKNKERLKEYAKNIVFFLQKTEGILLESLAYTLQVGREAMEERIAVITNNIDQLKEILEDYCNDKIDTENLFTGNVKANKSKVEMLIEGKEGQEFLKICLEKRKLKKIAKMWVSGIDIDYRLLYEDDTPYRISLPTYPFARDRYWVPEGDSCNYSGDDSYLHSNNYDDSYSYSNNYIDANREYDTEDNNNTINEPIDSNICNTLAQITSKVLKIKEKDINIESDLSEFGFDSISFVALCNMINQTYNIDIKPAILFEYTSIKACATYLREEFASEVTKYHAGDINDNPYIVNNKKNSIRKSISKPRDIRNLNIKYEPIAIIGMAAVMPKSKDVEKFWANLVDGVDMINEIPKDRWNYNEYYGDPQKEANKTNVIWGGFMNEVDKFDPAFFGISPREAELMDPQQRIFIETVWRAIEDSGYKPSSLSGTKTGVYVGVQVSEYGELIKDYGTEIQAQSATGISLSILANRISYLLNLHGPSQPIDTACSSSLVAVHQAIQSIRNGDCDIAIAGGVSVILSPTSYIALSKAGVLSPDGRCRTFDKDANGYVRGEGSGAIILKPLSNAINDGDNIYAVIKGTSVNHGGRATSLTAPNPKAQAELIINAWDKAGVDPRNISYIEAHGTGTALGDPIEINGIKKAFSTLYKKWNVDMPKKPYCGIGSVKTNIGHLETAAGVASIIKVLLSMKHGVIPGNLNFNELNPYIEIEDSPLYIVDKTMKWKRLKNEKGNDIPRIAAISSFGFGGVNSHIVLEEYKMDADSSPNASVVIALSAKNKERLKKYTRELMRYLKKYKKFKISLLDIAYTLQMGREEMEERFSTVVSSIDELIEMLKCYLIEDFSKGNMFTGNINTGEAKLNLLVGGNAGKEFIKMIIDQKEYIKLAQLWVFGVNIDWENIYQDLDMRPKRVSLPTYPFKRTRYWIQGKRQASATIGDGSCLSHLTQVPLKMRQTRTVPDCRKIQKDIIKIAANVLKVKEKEINLKSQIDEFGFDSIMILVFRNEINNKFNLDLKPTIFLQYKNLEDFSQFLLTECKNKNEKINVDCDYNKLLESLGYSMPNVVIRNINERKYKSTEELVGELIVDEQHKYFFDHPLDHVPGILLIQGIIQLSQLLAIQNLGDKQFYIKSIDIVFQKFCEKDISTSVQVELKEKSDNELSIKAILTQSNEVICIANCKIDLIYEKDITKLHKAEENSIISVDAKVVHKQNFDNILVSKLEIQKGDIYGDTYISTLISLPDEHILGEGNFGYYSILYLIEATRQFVTQIAHTVKGVPFGAQMIFVSSQITLERPVMRNLGVKIKCQEPIESGKIGESTLFDPTIILYDEGGEIGRISICGQIVDKEAYDGQRWK